MCLIFPFKDNEKIVKYRLEYNEKQGFFHFENIKENNKNTNGYQTICKNISVDQCIEFVSLIYEKHFGIDVDPTFENVLHEFISFLET
ncbi:hypothetical protein DNC80_14310 [Flavobacterium sp. SOK18b]|uniref:hypothetical protein n=1 Tax=Flavobacterium sp. SOK18b TaxID=797900 RepID=UPI0015F78D17|nr:hypothetical protein [Flavobacterium sp. SOK18b]MBB1194840.1 hypothetical protein [Flavobacterium sp. SOK18b]